MRRVFFFLLLLSPIFGWSLHGGSVVVIHGFMSTPASMKPIQKVLSRCGLIVYHWNYPSRDKYFEEHGFDLLETLQKIVKERPGEPIHFVAHSSGSLLLRSALNDQNCPEEAHLGRCVLIAPPNQGCSLARAFRGCWLVEKVMGKKSGWELMNFMPCQIASFGNFPESMDVLVIAGTKGAYLLFKETNDGFLTVRETYLNAPFFFKSFPLSHGDLLTHPGVLNTLKCFLFYPESIAMDSGI